MQVKVKHLDVYKDIDTMSKELKQVQKDIEDLQYKLADLYVKEKSLKRGTPPDLIGKYIYQKDNIFEMYMRVDSIKWNESLEAYVAIGPAIDISTRLIGIDYSLHSNNTFNLSEKYEISDEEVYNCALGKAVAQF